MFNLTGSEIIFILLLGLVVLGPEKLPGAIRKFTQIYGELRKMGTGFQTELKSALDEPMREMRETADLLREQADPSRLMKSDTSSTAAAEAAESDAERMRRERERAQEIGDRRAAERAASMSDREAVSDEARPAVAASDDVELDGIEHGERDESLRDEAVAPTPVDHEPVEVDEWADPIDLESARERRKNGEASA